ncbi:hypothetical protein ST47_g9943 [Ascochyta rabiei]|uniref:DUF7580 domain-containing protein n=1 Tax=Didymella rabiei TaxID=5454 RepID=A0A162WAF7_DIDRA|nr:hypothetical protein ST47_g9943 [Ascochyta rabiei]
MSGIEVASLVIGVLPILVEAVKSYTTIYQGFQTFRHYSKEVRTFSVQLKTQKGIFSNEIRLLLRLVEDAKIVNEMIEDASDSRWASKQLNDRLCEILQHDFELYKDTIEETVRIVEQLKLEVEKYNVLLADKVQAVQTDTIRSTIKHLRGAVKITFDKSKHELWLAKLRDRNADLSALRNQHEAFRQQTTSVSETVVRHKVLPVHFDKIQEASQKLHEALCRSWCCDDAAHRGHYAKLCVAAEANAEVQLDLAISCQEPSDNERNPLSSEPPLWLYVQSMTDATVSTIYSLFDMMRKEADDTMETEDQLKLAHKTALAMLQYNDTPWLNERWRLGDLNYFRSKGAFDETAFNSLHLSSQIPAPQRPTPIAANMEGIQGPAKIISEKVQYGINNVTLFFLGVALLEIAYWKPIEDQMKPGDHNNQIYAARRIASSRPSSLGPAYQKIAEKCLQCNFGFGTKLESKRLQTAVYNDVVCGLENLLIDC